MQLHAPFLPRTMMGETPSRRRRRAGTQVPSPGPDIVAPGSAEKKDPSNNEYYYDDDSDSESKGERGSHEERMFGSACSCSFGQFVLNHPCHCMADCGQACWVTMRRISKSRGASSLPLSSNNGKQKHRRNHHLRRKAMDYVDLFLVAGAATFALACLYCFFPGLFRTIPVGFSGRPATDEEVNRIPLLISRFDFKSSNSDLGGWQLFHHFFQPSSRVHTPGSRGYFDGLIFVGEFGKPRSTRPDEAEVAEKYLEKIHADKHYVETAYDTNENIQDLDRKCQRQSWMELYNPSCNAVHELDLTYDFDPKRAGLGDDQIMFDSFYISHGYWRDVWVVHQVQQDVRSILKLSRWKHDYNMEIFKYNLNDALIMERLTKSPRIVDLFGHCGFAVWVEAIPYEVEGVVVPGEGYIKQVDLHDEEKLNPQNHYTDEEKLNIALTMAESIADLHGFKDGLIIHDDIQLCQWLETNDGHLKLGDFNRAEIPLFDPEKHEYCKYNNGHGYGNYRSPEEFAAKDLDEKIDIWSFGNNIYGLLTGLWVFYEDEDDGVVHKKMKKGETAFIDERYRTQSFISGKLVEVMERCWSYLPEDRIEIFEAVRMLRLAKEEYGKIKQEEGDVDNKKNKNKDQQQEEQQPSALAPLPEKR